jgi:hypothetical protein
MQRELKVGFLSTSPSGWEYLGVREVRVCLEMLGRGLEVVSPVILNCFQLVPGLLGPRNLVIQQVFVIRRLQKDFRRIRVVPDHLDYRAAHPLKV